MKKLFLLALLCASFALISATPYPNQDNQDIILYSDYCDGWEDGYCEGWKDVKGQYAICPIAPICPIAEIGRTTYRDGYNRGFKAGRADAKE